jgi:hypothetical protein
MNCDNCKNYEAKEEKKEVKRYCHTCKHVAVNCEVMPCRSCLYKPDKPNWQPKEAKSPTKTEQVPSKSPSKSTTTYNGRQYREVKRKAKVGELVKIIKYCGGPVERGTVWTVERVNDEGRVYFKDSKTAYYPAYIVLEPIDQPKPSQTEKHMTDEWHPEIKEGTKSRVINGHWDFKTGEIVTLVHNDKSSMPKFTNGKDDLYFEWKDLAPLEDEAKPVKRVYTAEQIQEARDIVYRIMTEHLWDDSKSARLRSVYFASFSDGKHNLCDELENSTGRKRTIARLLDANSISDKKILKTATAYCADTDTWNDDVGRLVSLCKLTGEKMPKWVHS